MEDKFMNQKRSPGRSELLLFSRLLSLAAGSSIILELFFLPCSPGEAQIRNNSFFPERVVRLCKKLPRAVLESPSGNVQEPSRHGPQGHGPGVMLVLLG